MGNSELGNDAEHRQSILQGVLVFVIFILLIVAFFGTNTMLISGDYSATMVLVLVMCGLAVVVVILDRCLWRSLPIVFGLLACGGAAYLAWGALERLGYV